MTSRGAEKMKNDTLGVDVSKDHLDAHRLHDGAIRRFANDGGHQALIKWLAEDASKPCRVRTDRALSSRHRTRAGGIRRSVRQGQPATGKLANTDRLDAAMLARMGALLELEARPARSEALLELKELC